MTDKPDASLAYLYLDTETTGLPRRDEGYKAAGQPDLVQLGFQLVHSGATMLTFCAINREVEYIPLEAENVHHINLETAQRFGGSLESLLRALTHAIDAANTLVFHNAAYDIPVLQRAYWQAGQQHPTKLETATLCTKEIMTPICAIPSRRRNQSFKWPTLAEAYFHCFGRVPDAEHEALADVTSCRAVHEWLLSQQPASPKPAEESAP